MRFVTQINFTTKEEEQKKIGRILFYDQVNCFLVLYITSCIGKLHF